MFMDFAQWREAIEEAFSKGKLDYLDDIRMKGPAFVEDFIHEEELKRNVK